MNGNAPSVQRINFIEKEPFVLTYRRMLLLGGGVIGFCLVLLGVQTVKVHAMEKRLAGLGAEVKGLREERDRLFKEMAASKGPQNDRDALSQIFERTPPWAALLKELTASIPRSVWLIALESKGFNSSSGSPGSRGFQLSGRSEEAGSVTRFLKALTASSYFKNVVLVFSKRERDGGAVAYSFSIDLAIASSEGKGL